MKRMFLRETFFFLLVRLSFGLVVYFSTYLNADFYNLFYTFSFVFRKENG